MSKQDRQGVRTAPDLERKYNFERSFREALQLSTLAKKTAEEALAICSGLNSSAADILAEAKKYADSKLVEDIGYPGCYYRMVDGVKEWLNPPMLLGEEYRTTERFNGKAVYAKLVDFGSLPNSTSKTATYCSTGATAAVSVKAVLSDGCVLGEGYGKDIQYSNAYGVYIGNTLYNVHITTEADFSELSAEVLVKYIKD